MNIVFWRLPYYINVYKSVEEVPADTESENPLVQRIMRCKEIVASVTAVHVREHYEETGVLELEVGVGIENRIIPDLCTACFRLLYAESPDARDILRGIIVREIAAVHTEVDIQYTGGSEPYEEVAVGIEERDRKNVIFA